MMTRQGDDRTRAAKRILLVDDYPDALEMWGLYLRSLGYEVTTADNGARAVEAATRDVPDVIVMDLELPGMSGIDAARLLRQDGRTAEVPMIAATGYSHGRQLEQARLSGFDAVVIKPCDPGSLVTEIERQLSARRRSAIVPLTDPSPAGPRSVGG